MRNANKQKVIFAALRRSSYWITSPKQKQMGGHVQPARQKMPGSNAPSNDVGFASTKIFTATPMQQVEAWVKVLSFCEISALASVSLVVGVPDSFDIKATTYFILSSSILQTTCCVCVDSQLSSCTEKRYCEVNPVKRISVDWNVGVFLWLPIGCVNWTLLNVANCFSNAQHFAHKCEVRFYFLRRSCADSVGRCQNPNVPRSHVAFRWVQ